MIVKVNTGHAGTMTLKDGSKMNYGVIRVTRNLSKMIFYTGAGLREIFKPVTEEQKVKAAELKKLDEKKLMRMGYVAAVALSDIVTMD